MNTVIAQVSTSLPHWRWQRGMLSAFWLESPTGRTLHYEAVSHPDLVRPGAFPALDDDATGGCLLVLHGAGVTCGHRPDAPPERCWVVAVPAGSGPGGISHEGGAGATLGEACAVLALERGRWSGREA